MEMTLYRRIPEVVEAFHYEASLETMDRRYPLPDWLVESAEIIPDGPTRKIIQVRPKLGNYLYVYPGQWVIRYKNGGYQVLNKKEFLQKFEAMEG